MSNPHYAVRILQPVWLKKSDARRSELACIDGRGLYCPSMCYDLSHHSLNTTGHTLSCTQEDEFTTNFRRREISADAQILSSAGKEPCVRRTTFCTICKANATELDDGKELRWHLDFINFCDKRNDASVHERRFQDGSMTSTDSMSRCLLHRSQAPAESRICLTPWSHTMPSNSLIWKRPTTSQAQIRVPERLQSCPQFAYSSLNLFTVTIRGQSIGGRV